MKGSMLKDKKEFVMHLHRSPRFVRALGIGLLVLGLVVTVWTTQQRPSTAHAASGSFVQITNFGANPTNLQMWLYTPPNVKPHPAILLALHYCTGSGPAFESGTQFANLADQYGFLVIFPSVTRSGQCWDVYSNQGLVRNGGSDNTGLISMINYVEQHNNGDPNNVYVTGASSGAMMTDVMIAEYPDVFKAGAAFMGVPYHCFATGAATATSGSTWNSACANGQISMTPQQWGDLVRNDADPGYNGPRPRIELWHGTADGTLNYNNFGEEIKQWTNVWGLSQTPSSTDTPVSGWTRTRYGGTGTEPPVEGVSIAGAGHVLPENGMEAYAIAFMGLNNSSGNPTPTPTVGGSTPTPTPTSTSGAGCQVHYVVSNQWNTGFTATINITNTGSTTINGWTLKFSFSNGQVIQPGAWNGTFSQSGGAVTVTNLSYNGTIPPGGSLASPPGFNASWSGSNQAPTAFTLNGSACTVV
jgi:acetylxylan esterase